MIELRDFQSLASSQIAERFKSYFVNPVVVGRKDESRTIPFFQALASITASGKTAILCDALAQLSTGMSPPPIVLWMSKGKVVVEQTFQNLSPDGKYHHLISGFTIRSLAEFNNEELASDPKPIVYFATVSTFNQKDKEDGSRLVFRSEVDTTDNSTWESLKQRRQANGKRRPLILVYDEAHNLTDQQIELLLDLAPNAFLLASATMKMPEKLAREVALLKAHGFEDTDLVTQIDSKMVAESGLIKDTLVLAGYQTPMEEAVSAMLNDMKETASDAERLGINISPKAIYVCNTNIVDGDDRRKDNIKRPFSQREAPPIRVWRFLTEQLAVDPRTVAVYCNLAFDKAYPAPPEFMHFRGGDNDYDRFAKGSFTHIIFNLSLQEGWDDPECYFAYIDKSMESRVQIEQVVGRALRQPGGTHYPAQRLNTAHFYIRLDKRQAFAEIIAGVSKQIRSENPHIKLITAAPGKEMPSELQPKVSFFIPNVAIDSSGAVGPVSKLVSKLIDYSNDDGTNVNSVGSHTEVTRTIGEAATVTNPLWVEFEFTNKVRARWIFEREVRKRHIGALGIIDTANRKFDANIGIGSNAEAQIINVAEQVVDTYVKNALLVQKRINMYEIDTILVRKSGLCFFENSVHDGYDDFNPDELAFAYALDGRGVVWARNPARVGYGVPLTTLGRTKMFYPDFVVRTGDRILLIDPKGGHLLNEAVVRKLLNIRAPEGAAPILSIALLSRGKWDEVSLELMKSDGFTLWRMRADGSRGNVHFESLDELLDELLMIAE